jgi:hypothetical protein
MNRETWQVTQAAADGRSNVPGVTTQETAEETNEETSTTNIIEFVVGGLRRLSFQARARRQDRERLLRQIRELQMRGTLILVVVCLGPGCKRP